MEKKETYILIGAIFVGLCTLTIAAYSIGKDAMKREAVVAGHALWAYDDAGFPKFHWKDQQTVIGEYLGLGK